MANELNIERDSRVGGVSGSEQFAQKFRLLHALYANQTADTRCLSGRVR